MNRGGWVLSLAVAVLVALAWGLPALGADGAPPQSDAERQAKIAQAVRELAAADWDVREKATQLLWSMGETAEPALKAALASPDLEVVSRAKYVLTQFKYGLYPDTPGEVMTLVAVARGKDFDAAMEAVDKLMGMGRFGLRTIPGIYEGQESEEARGMLSQHVAGMVGECVPELVLRGGFDLAEELLAIGAAGGGDRAIGQYASYLLHRGRLEAKIRELSAQNPVGERARLMAWLYRAAGDLVNAQVAAHAADDQQLLENLLMEAGDWGTLARMYGTQDPAVMGFGDLAKQLATSRLAGDAKGFQEARSAVIDRGEHGRAPEFEGDQPAGEVSAPEEDLSADCARVLLLNDQLDDGRRMLERHGHLEQLFDLLWAQMRFAEAEALVEEARKESKADLVNLELQLALMWRGLGKKDQSRAILARLTAPPGDDPAMLEKVMWAELEPDMTDAALVHYAALLEHAGALTDWDEALSNTSWMLAGLFPERQEEALTWLKFFRKRHPTESPQELLKRTRLIMEGKPAESGLAAVAAEAARELPGEALYGIGLTCRTAGLTQAAEAYFRQAGTASAYLELGKLLASGKQWLEAAEQFHLAWEKEKSDPAGIYLEGWARSQAGQAAEGKRLMEAAVCFPNQYGLPGVLCEQGLSDDADRVERAVQRVLDLDYVISQGRQSVLFRRAQADGDFAMIERLYEWTRLRCSAGDMSTARYEGNLRLMCGIHSARARAHMAKGRVTEALAEARLALSATPGDVDVVLELVPELDKLGRRDLAEPLFAETFDRHERVLRDYPASALYRNNAAWLAAKCDRRLDRALELAREAVRLEPKSAGYLDTLAEVHFHRHERDDAVRLMKQCIEMEPGNDYFQKQLARFQADGL